MVAVAPTLTKRDMMRRMTRFTLKDILRGITLTAIGLGMLGAASNGAGGEKSTLRIFLITFGGVFIGYGLAFSVKWPPHRMMCAIIGMFAAQAWHSHSGMEKLSLIGIVLLFGVLSLTMGPPAKKGAEQEDELKRGEK